MQATRPITKRPPKKPSAGFAMALTVSCLETAPRSRVQEDKAQVSPDRSYSLGLKGCGELRSNRQTKWDSDVIEEGGLTDIAAPVSIRLTCECPSRPFEHTTSQL